MIIDNALSYGKRGQTSCECMAPLHGSAKADVLLSAVQSGWGVHLQCLWGYYRTAHKAFVENSQRGGHVHMVLCARIATYAYTKTTLRITVLSHRFKERKVNRNSNSGFRVGMGGCVGTGSHVHLVWCTHIATYTHTKTTLRVLLLSALSETVTECCKTVSK